MPWVPMGIRGPRGIWICGWNPAQRMPHTSIKPYQTLVAPMSGINRQTFTERGIVFQIGAAPRRIDLLTHLEDARKTNLTWNTSKAPTQQKERRVKADTFMPWEENPWHVRFLLTCPAKEV